MKTNEITTENIKKGQAVYSKLLLHIYDFYVLKLSNTYFWKCRSKNILDMFLKNTSSNHLDAGVGTGYFLKKQSLAKNTRLVLMDLNANSLHSCNNALKNISPQLMVHNVLDPISISIDKFDSISINYLLHCLPGTLPQKTILFKHFTEKLNPGGVLFGSTILNTANQGNYFAKKLMKIYNRKGIFLKPPRLI